MPGIAELALGAAPIAGGALLGLTAGNLRGPDFRGMITKDLDLLERIPPEQADRRDRLQHSIDQRIDDLIATTEKSRAIREIALSYRGNWRDIVVFICALLFTFIWWNVNHSRSNWMLLFIVMVVLCVVAAIYASRGAVRALQTFRHNRRQPDE